MKKNLFRRLMHVLSLFVILTGTALPSLSSATVYAVETGTSSSTSTDTTQSQPASTEDTTVSSSSSQSQTDQSTATSTDPAAIDTATASKEDSTLKADLRIFTETLNPDGSQKMDYLTGETVIPYAELSISGTGVVITNPKAVLTFPKQYVDGQPTFAKTDSAISWTVTKDATNWYVTYNFDKLVGGQISAVPFPFKMTVQTPNNFPIPITYELFDSSNQLIATASNTFISKALPNVSSKEVRSLTNIYSFFGYEEINGQSVAYGTVYDTDNVTASGASAPKARFKINYESTSTNGYGQYRPTNVRIIEKLPAEAVMAGTPNANGKYVYDGFEWTYDPATHTAVFEVSNGSNHLWYINIDLQFPNQPYETVFTNKAILIENPGTAYEVTHPEVTASVMWKRVASLDVAKTIKYHSFENFYDPDVDPREVFTEFRIGSGGYSPIAVNDPTTGNPLTIKIHNIVDHDMDNRLYYRRLKLTAYDSIAAKVTTVGYKVYGVKADGSKVQVIDMPAGTAISVLSSWQEIDDQTDQFEKLSIEFNQPLELLTREHVEFNLQVNVKDDVWKNDWKTEKSNAGDNWKSGRMSNSATSEMTRSWTDGSGTIKTTDKSNVVFSDDAPRILGYNNLDYEVIYGNDNVREMSNAIGFYGKLMPGKTYIAKNVRFINLLPEGIDYVPGSGPTVKEIKLEPKIIPNYKNTGKTALIWEIGDTTSWTDFSYKVNVTLYANSGANIVDSYLVWDNNDTLPAEERYNKDLYTDALDLDDDGDVAETFLYGFNTITFIPPRDVIVRKSISSTIGNWSNLTYTDLDKDIYYKVGVFNNSTVDFYDVTAVDVFPAAGDHMIVSNSAGAYLPRGSVFPVSLTQSLESLPANSQVLTKWTVYYSTDAQGADLASVRNATWMTASQISDFTQVKMIKMVLNSGQKLAIGETASFVVKAQVPNDTNLTLFDAATNSAAVSLNAFDFVEGNKVTNKIVKYQVDGILFNDLDKNTQLDAGESKLSGYTVQLMNADGTPYTDSKGQTVTAVTDTNGYYLMNVYERGQYYVKFSKKTNGIEFTGLYTTTGTSIENDNVIGNDISQSTTEPLAGISTTFTLGTDNMPTVTATTTPQDLAKQIRANATSLLATRNIGVVFTGDLTIKKVDENGNALAGVTFKVEQNGTVVATATTDANGLIELPGIGYGTFTITETATLPDYALDSTPKTVTLSATNNAETIQIINAKKRSNITLTKVDKDSQAALAGVTFELRQGSTVIDTQTTDSNGQLTFANVVYGDYTAVETKTLDAYVLDSTPITVKVTENGKTIDLGKVNNSKKISNITLTKVDKDSQAALAGVTFELRQGSTVIDTQTTDSNGQLTFTNVVYGDYTVVETKTLDAYVLDSTPITVKVTENGKTIDLGKVNNSKKVSNITLTKVDKDSQAALAGVTFELRQGSTVIDTQTTDSNGQLTFANVVYGDYTVVETKTLDAYVLDSTPITVKVTENGKTIDLGKVNNSKKVSNITLTKVDKDSQDALAGVTFELRQGSTVIDAQTTDSNGQLTFTNVVYGDYTVVETKTLDAYVLDSTPITVKVTENGKTIDLGKVNNSKKISNITLTKVDKDSQAALAGVTFELRQGSTVIDAQTTDSNGQLTLANVVYGDYTVVETKTLDAYVLDSTPITVKVTENGKTIDLGKVNNSKKVSNITLTKVDKDSQDALAGVTFELRQGSTVIDAQTTDSNGQLTFTNVVYGDYTVVETKTLDAYVLDSTPITVKVTENGKTIDLGKVNNSKKISNITLTKVDKDSQAALAGVTFELRQGSTVIDAQTTDSNGQLTLANVVYGDYTVVETKTLDAYVLDSTPITVKVTENGKTIDLGMITNSKKPVAPVPPKTPGGNTPGGNTPGDNTPGKSAPKQVLPKSGDDMGVLSIFGFVILFSLAFFTYKIRKAQ